MKKRISVTFQDVWWVRISSTTHYNSIYMIINCLEVCINRGTPGGTPGETPTSSTWHVPSRLFRSRSAGFLCELHTWRRRCFSLCESPSVENWWTTALEIIRRRCVKRASVCSYLVRYVQAVKNGGEQTTTTEQINALPLPTSFSS